MRIKYGIKDIVFATVIAMSFALMAMTSFASPASPTETPTPYNDSPTPLYPSHIDGSLDIYYTKFLSTTTWTYDQYIQTDGTVVTAVSSFNFRLSAYTPINPSVDKMIAAIVTTNFAWFRLRSVTFYDQDLNVIPDHNYCISQPGENNSVFKWFDIPDNASYFRISIRGSFTGNSLNRYKIAISPQNIEFNYNTLTFVDEFWRDYLSVQNYMIYPNGKIMLTATSDYPFDELYLQLTLSNDFFSATYVSATVYSEVKDGAYNNSYYPVNYTDRDYRGTPFSAHLNPFYYGWDYNTGNTWVVPEVIYSSESASYSTDNPCSLLGRSSMSQISGLILTIPFNMPTGLTANSTVSITISDIYLDDYAVLFTQLSVNTSDSIDSGLAQVPLPSPSFDLNDYINDAFANVDTSMALTVFGWYWSVPFLVSMTSIVAVVALISYILFGKKG